MKTLKQLNLTISSLALISFGLISNQASADQQILDDLIVVGSICAGQDCNNGESFGFDTIRLKENNLRIKAQDTSTSASFPSRDWQITFNDSSNGGANKFSIDDIDGGRTPFTIEAGAPSHSLYVDDGGRLGLGTSTPVADVHVKSGNTPTLRLEQDGTSGFGSQIWDMAGNEANFFIRDATTGSTLPFRLFPGAPSNALTIEGTTGDIGLGTTSPETALDISRAGTGAQIQFEDRTAGHQWRIGQSAANIFSIADADAGSSTQMQFFTNGNLFVTNSAGTSTMTLNSAGNMVIPGSLTQGSDINSKEDIKNVDTRSVLDRISQLPIATWKYKADKGNYRHMGPMSQDFYKSFSLGLDDKHISTLDTSGVALAGIQELAKQFTQKDKIIQSLQNKIEILESNDKSKTIASLQEKISRLEVMIKKIVEFK